MSPGVSAKRPSTAALENIAKYVAVLMLGGS